MKLGKIIPIEFNVAVFIDEEKNEEVKHELWTKEGQLYAIVDIKAKTINNKPQ